MNRTLAPTAMKGRSRSTHDAMARGLGYFSIALGITELFAARALCRSLGMEGNENLIKAYGAREVATGVAILASHDPTPWIYGRVAGDALDIATVATALRGENPKQNNVIAALGALAGVTALDLVCAVNLTTEKGGQKTAIADYSNRTGFPKPPASMAGAARDFEVPRDMRVPDSLRGDLFQARSKVDEISSVPSGA